MIASFLNPSVVGKIDDERVAGGAALLQVLHQLAHRFIQPFDVGVVASDISRKITDGILRQQALGWIVRRMRQKGRIPQKERLPLRPVDEIENVWINLTARGPVEDAETGVFDGLDYGREVIVRSFNDLVSPDAKKYWGVQLR